MNKPLTLLIASLAALASTSPAKEDAGRLELKAGEGAILDIIEIGDGAKLINQTDSGATIDRVVGPGEWTSTSVKFKTNVDTDVRIRLSARFTQADEMWVLIDNVKAEGFEVQNPDFEAGTGAGAPTGWKFLKAPNGTIATHVNDASKAASGDFFVKVSHGSPVIQVVHVPKDTEVTLTFSARSADQ